MENAEIIFQALGSNIRLKIIKSLLKNRRSSPNSGGMCVCDLVGLCGIANSTMTHHLDWLKSVGLLTSEKRGTWIYYDVNTETLKRMKEYIKKEL